MRYVLLDRVTSIVPGSSLEARKVFPLNDECFDLDGAFFPIVPEPLLVETLAQAGGVLLCSDDDKVRGVVLGKIEEAVFHGVVQAGRRLDVRVEILDNGDPSVRLRSSAYIEGELVAEMVFFLARRSLDDSDSSLTADLLTACHRERARLLGVVDLLEKESG